MNYEIAVQKIVDKENFSLSRWGDGEWNCILTPNDDKGNCDGHKYFKDMSEALQKVLKSNPKYYLGMQNFAINQNGHNIKKWQEDNGVKINWEDSDLFHRASIKGQFFSFFEALQSRDVILVAPKYILASTRLPIEGLTVEAPEKDCWLEKNRIVDAIKNLIELEDRNDYVVLICASMAANVIVDELYNWNQKNTYLDMGSVFDPYVGNANRTYHKKLIENLETFKTQYLNSKIK